MNRQFLNNEDVISVSQADMVLIDHKMFKISGFLTAIFKKCFGANPPVGKKWCFDGVECSVLSPNKTWRKGKIKISLEFIPDEYESPLDEIRNHPSFPNS